MFACNSLIHYKMIIQGIIFAVPGFWILEYQLVKTIFLYINAI